MPATVSYLIDDPLPHTLSRALRRSTKPVKFTMDTQYEEDHVTISWFTDSEGRQRKHDIGPKNSP